MHTSDTTMRTVPVIRYITPLREGGSLPAIVEAEDGFMYVLKFRGAGQGVKALIAELIGGQIADTLGLNMPELIFAPLDSAFGRTEPDEEIQDLLKASTGLNLGLHFLQTSITYDPVVNPLDATTSSTIVWMDCLLTNVDRTPRNTNMLIWHEELWVIDHGAALYFHHSWSNWEEAAKNPFPMVKDHVLLRYASKLVEMDSELRQLLPPEKIRQIVDLLPDEWLINWPSGESPDQIRDVYFNFLTTRIASSEIFVKEAQHARSIFI